MKALRALSIPGLSRARWIFLKETTSFFGSNFAPLSLGLVAFMCGIGSALLSLSQGATYDGVTRFIFHYFYIIIIIAALLLSMSAFVSEKRQGTMELLYTLPISDVEMVVGKFLMGAVFLTLLSISMTLVYVVGIAEAPWYVAVSGALGLIFVGMYAYSVGLLASSLTDSYLVALLVALVIVLAIDIGGFMAGLLPSPAKEVFAHLHGLHQYNPFTRGRISLKSSMFFLSLCAFFLFLTVRVLESRRWRGR